MRRCKTGKYINSKQFKFLITNKKIQSCHQMNLKQICTAMRRAQEK